MTANTQIGATGVVGGTFAAEEVFPLPMPCGGPAGLLPEDMALDYHLTGRDCSASRIGGHGVAPASGMVNVALSWLGGASCPDGTDNVNTCEQSHPDWVMGLAVYALADTDSAGLPVAGAVPLAFSFHFGGTNEYVQFSMNPGDEYVFRAIRLDELDRVPETRLFFAATDGECMVSPDV